MPGTNTSPDRPLAHKVAIVRSGRTERLAVLLRDGRLIAVPLQLYPSLKAAKPAARKRWRLVGNGQGIHWPDLDLDLSTEGIVRARPDRTRAASSRMSDSDMAGVLLQALELADKPMSAGEVATLIERAFPPAKVRAVVSRLSRDRRRERRRKSPPRRGE